MKVDLPSLIIGILALATFFVPITWYQISEKIKEKRLNNELTQYAQKENLTLTNTEIWSDHYALGIDKKCKKLVYLNQSENKDQKKVVDLSKVQKCKVSNGTKTVRSVSGNKRILTNIDLLFHYRESGKSATSLEVYNNNNGRTLSYEISIANKLARSIRPLLNSTSEHSYRIPKS
ncbi:MAG: hypothetical protein U5K72_12980 [Balneolaceae bacterium]|nr:hypothetical protein [Balneolaceae bacterium]